MLTEIIGIPVMSSHGEDQNDIVFETHGSLDAATAFTYIGIDEKKSLFEQYTIRSDNYYHL